MNLSSNKVKKEPTTSCLQAPVRCRLHISSAGRLFIVQVEPQTVLCGGGGVVLRPVEVDDHVEGKFLSVDGGHRARGRGLAGQDAATEPVRPRGGRRGGKGGAGALEDDVVRGAGVALAGRLGGGGGRAAEGEAGGGDGGPGNAAVAQLRPHTDRVLLVSQVVAGVVVEGLDVAAGPSEVLRSENFFITSTTHLQPLAGSSLSLLSRKTGEMS